MKADFSRARSCLLNSERLGVTDVRKVGDELESVDNLATSLATTFDTEAQDATVTPLEVLLGRLVVWVALQTGVRDPADLRVVLEPFGQVQSILRVAFGAETKRLNTEEELLGSEGVESGAQVTEDLDTGTNDEGDGAEGFPELEAVVTRRRFDELGEASSVLAPVELARIDDDAADGGAVTANPLGSRVDDDVSAVLDGSDEVATGTKCVINLLLGQ